MGQFNLSDPAVDAAAVTPNDGANLPSVKLGGEDREFTSALGVAVAGNIRVITRNNADVTLTVPSGILPLQVNKVFATGTTATGITSLY